MGGWCRDRRPPLDDGTAYRTPSFHEDISHSFDFFGFVHHPSPPPIFTAYIVGVYAGQTQHTTLITRRLSHH